jgi:large subunit ribosomal protein L19
MALPGLFKVLSAFSTLTRRLKFSIFIDQIFEVFMSKLNIEAVHQENKKKDAFDFRAGDTVTVNIKIMEKTADGKAKSRIQPFKGVVIQRKGMGISSSLTVRKISNGIGVERIFQMHSPLIDSIEVDARGKVRRARIYYMRNLRGKAARIVERKVNAPVGSIAPVAVPASAAPAPVPEPAVATPATES